MIRYTVPAEFAPLFHARRKHTKTDFAERTHWYTLDGRFRVTYSRPRFGRDVLAPTWYAEHADDLAAGWSIISRHRKPGPAFFAVAVAQHRLAKAES